ncbi:DUF29 domain-containing protein [Craurococcus roseus]|uniref:DUF29 domain-containing protein n=1 Tax=Craurococcus roseus TaxID=77585 RepID=A0ABP3PV49_9PROT
MGSLYHADILLWCEQQADLLRRLSRGERVSDAVDWENVIEELGDVGRSEFNSVAGLLEVGLTHLLLAHASPRPEPVGHWRSEARTALAGAARRYAPSMGPRLDLRELWSLAVTTTRDKLAADGGPARPIPADCPFAVQDLVQRVPDLDALLARLAQPAATPAGG